MKIIILNLDNKNNTNESNINIMTNKSNTIKYIKKI